MSYLLESAPDAMLVVDQAARIVQVNAQTERMFGYRREQLVGEPIETLIPERFQRAHRIHRNGFLAAPSTRPMGAGLELFGRREDGSEFPVDISLSAAGDPRGELIVAAIRDVTEAKRVADEIRRLADAAEEANEAKSEFLSRMSHELRTPLNAIIGFGQVLLLDEEDEPSPRREGLEQILHAGRHLLSLINEMLDMARIESGRIALSLEPVPVGPVVAQAIELVAPQASAREVSIGVDADRLEPLLVVADQQRLLQVLVNLLGNAVKYNAIGGHIEVWCEAADGRVGLNVSDTGRGIPADEIDRAFEPFERLVAVGDATEGTGLGLPVTKRLVEAMGGSIRVKSTLGVGSTFTVELDDGHVGTLRPPPAPLPHRPGARSLLYIEDNLVSQRVVERILERLPGIDVLTAAEGTLGVEIARRYHPDLILLDVHLPDMDGEEVLGRLKRDPATRDIPVVILSAAISRTVERQLLDQGAAAFLGKPFDADVLLTVVDELAGPVGGAAA